MSLESWKKEFYPTSAKVAAEGTAEVAIRHSLLKWEGLTHENLAKHNVKWSSRSIVGERGAEFNVDGSTCALCHKFEDPEVFCEVCPLSKIRDGFACDRRMFGEDFSPWGNFKNLGNPHPMIGYLKLALEKEINGAKSG